MRGTRMCASAEQSALATPLREIVRAFPHLVIGLLAVWGLSANPSAWADSTVGWRQVATTGPGIRNGAGMAFDSARGRISIQGGAYFTPYEDTWEWDGIRWQKAATGLPGVRDQAVIAYDSARGKTVLFGGSPSQIDTFEWDGVQWQKLEATGPGARSAATMVFDSARAHCILYGGSATQTDTWAYGPLNVTPPFSMDEAIHALQCAAGLLTLSQADLARCDVETADASAGCIDTRDAIRIARKVAGLEPNP